MPRNQAIATATAFAANGRFLADLTRRVAIATESQKPERLPECFRYLSEISADFGRLGFSGEIIENPDPTGGPLLIARRHEGDDLPTLLVYGHGDVVAGMEGAWANGRDPWRVSVEGERIYGRGTADNKGQHTIVMLALEAVLATRGVLGFNTVALIETSEETGSAGLREVCEEHRSKLVADWLIASDGPRLAMGRPTLDGGTRGTVDFDLVCDLRSGAHHSGNWGGLIANPAVILANAIASLISATGRINVRAILPAEVPPSVRVALAQIELETEIDGPELDPWWGEPGLSQPERVFGWTALEVLAMTAGTPAQPINAIPPQASARLQIRYTVDTNPATFMPAIRDHLDEHGFHNVAVAPKAKESDWGATRLDPEHPLMRWAAASVEKTTGVRPTILPNAGGSLPNDCFADILGMPTVWVPHSYSGCSQHAPDEHLLKPLVVEGLAIMTGLFWDLGTSGRPGQS
ncbi:M20 family metallopeptidase [Aminobacter anthyllidis]|uniref:M20 family metallopeptidase n=1 Tax=Aminobacter anthyllidis TaxID=1035067 RepID=A0A9X1AHX9_9HYPH|nr:M20 family metallopeptidase [Aminobacter anthyllidis]MBT1160167.1 M20 family metallopeptidase [Aminobacter anthyllidis]